MLSESRFQNHFPTPGVQFLGLEPNSLGSFPLAPFRTNISVLGNLSESSRRGPTISLMASNRSRLLALPDCIVTRTNPLVGCRFGFVNSVAV